MARKRYAAEQAIGTLREAEVLLSQGEKMAEICRSLGISEQTYYRWRREYGGLKVDQPRSTLRKRPRGPADEQRLTGTLSGWPPPMADTL